MKDSLGNSVPFPYSVGDRVQLHPATGAWMQGDRYGQIQRIGTKFAHVLMDRSNRILRVPARNILEKV